MKNVNIPITKLSHFVVSETSGKLLEFLKQSGGAWIDKCMDIVFEKPKYPTDNDREKRIVFWQWESNSYGNTVERPIFDLGNGEFERMVFTPNVEVDYRTQISNAYQQLKKNGLAFEKNNGFNEYFLYTKSK